MRFSIQAERRGPLNVMPEFPDARLAVLEGLNGVGKTLAVRILQACTGTMPYRAGSAALRSLSLGLGEFEVSVTGLDAGVGEIRWRGESSSWNVSADSVTDDWFSEITIDGTPATLAEARAIIEVIRLAGDEGILETFAHDAEDLADSLSSWERTITASESPLSRLDEVADDAIRMLGEWTPARYAEVAESIPASEDAVRRADVAVQDARKRLQDLEKADALRRRILQSQGASASIPAQLKSLEPDFQRLNDKRLDVQRQIDSISAKAAGIAPLLKDLTNKRRTLDRNREKLGKALLTASAASAPLGIEADEGAANTRHNDLVQRHAELSADLLALDATPYMRNLLDSVAGEMKEAERRGLQGQIAVVVPDSAVELTVSQARTGVLHRRSQLDVPQTSESVEALREELSQVEREMRDIDALLTALEEVATLRRRVRNNEDQIANLLTATGMSEADSLQTLEAQRHELDDQILKLATERSILRGRLEAATNTDVAALAAQLDASLQRLGASREHLDQALKAAEQDVGEAQLRFTAAKRRLELATAELARANSDLFRVGQMIAESEDWRWLQRALPGEVFEQLQRDPPARLAAIDRVRTALSEVIDRLATFRRQIVAVGSALRDIAHYLRGESSARGDYVNELEAWLGVRFSAWISEDAVRAELFPNAAGPITVDLSAREVQWNDAGIDRSRPLEAFSSGEQAFAYTRARLAMLEGRAREAVHRFIVLDEFGAFMAHGRRNVLLKFLNERLAREPRDQVVIILPAGTDYDQLAKTSSNRDARRFSDKARSIRDVGYTIDVVVP